MEQDQQPSLSTQDYIDAIKEAKANGKAISINYGSLPEGVVASAINTELNNGLSQDYQDSIGEAASRGKTISLDFSQIKPQEMGGGSLSPMQTLTNLVPSLLGKGGALETPWSRLSNGMQTAGDATAGFLGKIGVNPTLAAIPATAIAMTPDLVNAAGAIAPMVGAANRVSDIANAGSRIGAAEAKAGVPDFFESLPRPGGAASTTEWVNNMHSQISAGTAPTDAQTAKQISDQVDFIYKNNKNVPLTGQDNRKLALIGKWAQQTLNNAVDSTLVQQGVKQLRSTASADYSTLMNAVAKAKLAAKIGTGVVGGAGVLAAIRSHLTK